MLAIFNKELVTVPQELNSPASLSSSRKPKLPVEILKEFHQSFTPSNAFSLSFGDAALLAYAPPQKNNRLFCGMDGIYCVFLGGLNNLCSLLRQYGLSKGTDEAMFIIEAYRTLRDRGPYPAHQVLKDLEGTFGFVIYDTQAGHVFAALGENKGVRLFWGIAADGSVVISDNLEVIKGSCAKSYAPFPNGCMFHSEQGLVSFEHPRSRMKAMPRIDSEGVMCGANFQPDAAHSRITNQMPRVGSEANWALWASNA
ncbi:putative Stem-specific protein TSJT1 [Tripterygium wilfordii]|uniref:Putative Stem-specific protein TSJT1 n=1 Tax=Tripterygium wilfordii TaxID=458696 RepID=A0A7J7C429_TRIWF|nr:stem-specific protein TSJT1-like [Tripterygium wilfordii]KAF5728919.1 putative Stem-specific protein TSJT1 [Tripterygium wilfordii]